ncbi:RICIN domain-containing protein [Streptomyces sp. NPDC020951]|uniref:RICIN domain-containing protein n=1 Tax=Streptomyces sp. NPDC020951 TaxID=3365104 RepID=UPI00379C7494
MYEHLAQQAPHDPKSASGNLPEHAPAVRAYAEAFCPEPRDATDLAGHVLARGSQLQGPDLRTALLADVRRTADNWLRDGRSELLHPEFRAWSQRAADAFGPTDTLRRAEHSSVFLAAFEQLADQSRAALWLCLAETGESASAARILNTSEEFAESLAQSARSRLVDTFLRLRADRTADPGCVHYGGMLGVIARGTHREAPADLTQHLDACRFCAHDLRLLRTLASGDAQEVRRLLVDQVLVWGGPAYREARPADQAPAAEPDAPPEPARDVRRRPESRRRRRPVYLVAVTVVVTAVLTTAVLRLLSGSDSAEGAEETGRPEAGVSASASPAPEGPASPSPEGSASASAQESASASPTTGASTGTIALESVSTGRCVTGPADSASPGPGAARPPDPVLAACDPDGGSGSDTTQQWRVVRLEKGAVALVNVASKLCLDIAGDRVEGDAMQQRPCAYEHAGAPFPEDQAFLPMSAAGDSFVLICQDNPEIALGTRSGRPAMLATGAYGEAVRFALDDGAANALGW